jgi:hypothetical protein
MSLSRNAAEFIRDIEAFKNKVAYQNGVIFRKITLDLYTDIVLRTPRDTGLAAGNWQIGVNKVPTEIIDRKDPDKSLAATQGLWEASKMSGLRMRDDTRIYIANNLVYIVPLEHGHSQIQAPNGMVNLAIEAMMARLQGQ